MKVSIHAERPPGEAILEEDDTRADSRTDTARLRRAGAYPVFWVRTTRECLGDDLRHALARLEAPVVIVEGNSVLEHLDPDYAVFIMGPSSEDFKPSAYLAVAKAHTVVINGDRKLTGTEALRLERWIKGRNPKAKVILVSELGREKAWEVVFSRVAGRLGGEYMSAEVDEKVLEAVKAAAKEGRIACAVALKLAEELGVPSLEVGKAANALGIKIVQCSLGCF
jgi:molybdopterin-guanine dinucleotide biosynthesis protein